MNFKLQSCAVLVAASLTACGPAAPSEEITSEINRLKQENETLKSANSKLEAAQSKLQKQVEELQQTPEVLLAKVEELLFKGEIDNTAALTDTMKTRFGDTPQLKRALAAVAKAKAEEERKLALAKELEARGFYAVKTNMTPVTGPNTLKVESLKQGKRWIFDYRNDGEYHYREAEREHSFVLMNATVHSKENDPDLPDVGIYVIDGKEMRRVDTFRYEFRRWQSYGTFIGLYHDHKNDFAHTPSVPFNAAASISTEDLKKPFAIVATDKNCHERGDVIGQPDIRYSARYDCAGKSTLTIDDFKLGDYKVVSFFNKPKGV